jgi:hypothetical protein
MTLKRVLAGIAVPDVEEAEPWYEALFGRPPDARPMDGLSEWHVPSSGVLQLVEKADSAGRSILTLDYEDLAGEVEAIRERGVDVGEIDATTSDKVLIAGVRDPFGNEITLVEAR